jgi:hypothetical protein
MPGSVTVVSGLIERQLGRGVVASSALQRMGKGGALMAGGGNIFVGASAAGVGNGADTTEDTLFTVTLPPNSLDVVGRQIMIEAYGSIAATSATKDAKIYFGSTQLAGANFHATTTGTGIWLLNAIITKTGSNAQTCLVQMDTTLPAGTLARSVNVPTAPTETDTAGIVIKVTGQSSVATANLVLCNMFTVSGWN